MKYVMNNKLHTTAIGDTRKTSATGKLICFILIASFVCVAVSSFSLSFYLLTICLFLICAMLNKRVSVKTFELVILLVVVFLAGYLFSYINGYDNQNWTLIIGMTINAFVFCNIAYDGKIVNGEADILRVLKILNILGLVCGIVNVVENYARIMSLNMSVNASWINFSSFFPNRNTYGVLLSIFIMSDVLLFSMTQKSRYLLFAVFNGINLILTFSRTCCLITFVMIGLFYFCESKSSHKTRVAVIFLAIIGVIMLAIVVDKYYDLISHFLIRRDVGNSNRTELWEAAFNAFLNSPVFGNGPGSGESVIKSHGGTMNSYHSTYLGILADGGICLTLLYASLYINSFKQISCFRRHNRTLYNFFLSLLVGFLIYMLFEYNLFFGMGVVANVLTVFLIVLPIQCARVYKARGGEF